MTDSTYTTKVYKTDGGDTLVIGGASFAVIDGQIIVTGLPTTDPEVLGALWAEAGLLCISAGAPVSSS